jgi:cytochrome P450
MSIHMEVRDALEKDDLNLEYLSRRCPRLKSVYHEVLRLRKRDLAFRKVEHDTQIGGKCLRAGNFALIPVCQLHENKDIFGEDCLEFSPDRFLDRPNLANHQSYKPYGGGRSYCPGRFFAMQEIFGLVALLLLRFDIQLSPQSKHFPRPDESSLTLGVSRPLPGSDMLVTLSQTREG